MKKFKTWNWWKIGACTLAGGMLCGALVYYNFIYKNASEQGDGFTPAKVGDACPDFTVDYVYSGKNGKMVIDESKSFTLSEQKGKVVVLNFWTTYCQPCKVEIPHFNELYEKYADDGLEMAILNGEFDYTAQSLLDDKVNKNDPKKSDDDYDKYYQAWQNYGCTFARFEEDNDILSMFDVSTKVPVTIVVDREGVIIYMAAASLTYERLEEIVLPALALEE
ncbi:MAG: redoxin domain-containing protein [Clostridia bacterium]|nr:redoxin domain-containing protein [Clostridia bacterium]